MPPAAQELVPRIGLEIHAELATRSKVFCACSTAPLAPPNTQTCPVCLGLPGTLPVLNRQAVEFALRVALALGCRISEPAIFERKNYYYPDLPKNYQISQKRQPFGYGGSLEIAVGEGTRRVRITDVHLEEDTGKLLHPGGGAAESLVDFNRSGVPLLEVVGEPDLESVDEVMAYMTIMRSLLLYLGVSEARMEEGQLRFEANISVAPPGAELGNRVEMKNLNSFRAVQRSLEYEIARQKEVVSEGGRVARETRLWDDARGVTEPMRSKEEAQDYRYFPEPDLVPVVVDAAWLERTRAALPELPGARRERFGREYALPPYDAALLTSDRALADFFEQTVRLHREPKTVSNWVMGEMLRLLGDRGLEPAANPLTPGQLAGLLDLVSRGVISLRAAKGVFEAMFGTERQAADIVAEQGLTQISDTSELEAIVDRVIAAHPQVVADFQGGKERSLGFLIGQVMRHSQGRANPQLVGEILKRKLAGTG